MTKQLLNQDNCTIEDLIAYVEKVKENGDIVVIKLDGERNHNQYTILITFPLIKEKEMIRADESTLKTALIKVLNLYFGIN